MSKQRPFEDPTFDTPPLGGGAVPYEPEVQPPRSRVGKTLQLETARLMAIPGVRSVGEARGPIGDAAIEIGVADASVLKSLPKSIDGIPVITRIIGDVEAY